MNALSAPCDGCGVPRQPLFWSRLVQKYLCAECLFDLADAPYEGER